MKWLWDLFEGIQVNAVLREKISLAEQKFKDMERENKNLKEQVAALTSEVEGLRNQVNAGTQPPPSAIPLTSNEADALCILQSWWGRREAHLLDQAVEFAAVDRDLNLVPGMTKRLLEQAVQKHNYVVDTKGDKYITFRSVSPSSEMPVWSNPGWNDPHNPFRRRR